MRLHGYDLPLRSVCDDVESGGGVQAIVDCKARTVCTMERETEAAGKLADLFAAAPDLADALKECADDLECELNARYPAEMRRAPSQELRYQRDMKPVLAARAALAKAGVK